MRKAIIRFKAAHERYLKLQRSRSHCRTPDQRERAHIAIMRAYLEVQRHARVIAGLQRADGIKFAELN